jgi:replicative DNA helicase
MSLPKYPGFSSLPVHGVKDGISRAKREISIARSTNQTVLLSSLPKINRAMMGGFRFKNIYLFAGASGSGKSYFLNQLRNDFLDPMLNGSFMDPVKILSFSLEMPMEDELIRTVSSRTGMSYGDIVSADSPLGDTEYNKVMSELEQLDHPDVHFVETSGNRMQIFNTIVDFHQKFPNHKLVVTYDHTLLTEEYDEKSEIEMIAKLSKIFVKLKKSSIEPMVIMLGQLNDKIEDVLRIQNYNFHYPLKKDIHGSKQLFWACDYVGVLHRPELLNIQKYGPNQIDTKDLLMLHVLKSRKGRLGVAKLRAAFEKGKIEE